MMPVGRLVWNAARWDQHGHVVRLESGGGFCKCFDRRLDGRPCNHKRVHRVYFAMSLNLPRRTKKRVPTRIVAAFAAPVEHNRFYSLAVLSPPADLWASRGI